MFHRRGHYRTNCYGTTFYVHEHGVRRSKYTWTLQNITIPNALCPVCGKQVFYYENINGSRVYFDELGPDWPKHHCTNNIKKPRKPKQFIKGMERRYKWQEDGWSPLINLTEEDSLGDWIMLSAEAKERNLYWLKKNIILEKISSPVFMKNEGLEAKFQWWEAQNSCKRTQYGLFNNDWTEIKIKNEIYDKKRKFIIWGASVLPTQNNLFTLRSNNCPTKPNKAARYHLKNLDDKIAVVRLSYRSKQKRYFMVYKL